MAIARRWNLLSLVFLGFFSLNVFQFHYGMSRSICSCSLNMLMLEQYSAGKCLTTGVGRGQFVVSLPMSVI